MRTILKFDVTPSFFANLKFCVWLRVNLDVYLPHSESRKASRHDLANWECICQFAARHYGEEMVDPIFNKYTDHLRRSGRLRAKEILFRFMRETGNTDPLYKKISKIGSYENDIYLEVSGFANLNFWVSVLVAYHRVATGTDIALLGIAICPDSLL